VPIEETAIWKVAVGVKRLEEEDRNGDRPDTARSSHRSEIKGPAVFLVGIARGIRWISIFAETIRGLDKSRTTLAMKPVFSQTGPSSRVEKKDRH